MSTRRIAFFGRKGVGVSTVAGNITAALAKSGQGAVLRQSHYGEETIAGPYLLYDLGESTEALVSVLAQGRLDRLVAISGADQESLATINSMLWQLLTLPEAHRPAISLVGNRLPATYADALLDDFARRTEVTVAAYIPHSIIVWRSAFFGETVIEASPRSYLARLYRQLAQEIAGTQPLASPAATALSGEEFREWSGEWGDRLSDFSEGLVREGAAI